VVTVVNLAGHVRSFDFTDLEVPGPMQCSLAAAFATQSRRWSGHTSAGNYWRRLRGFARFLAGLPDPPDDLDGLTAAMLKRWRAANIGSNDGRNAMAMIRVLLRQDPRLRTGPVADELARRIPSARPARQSYDAAEREQVLLAARRDFRSALLRIRENTRLLQRWHGGELPEGSRPGGLIALAIQYGHMRTILDARTSSGYASRSRDGIHSVLSSPSSPSPPPSSPKPKPGPGQHPLPPATSPGSTADAVPPGTRSNESRVCPEVLRPAGSGTRDGSGDPAAGAQLTGAGGWSARPR
jgi:hypothetical protein